MTKLANPQYMPDTALIDHVLIYSLNSEGKFINDEIIA